MFNLGMPEIILILVVALIVMGPKKLPEMAKSLGKGLREFRKAADDLKESVEKDLRPDDAKPSKEKNLISPDQPTPSEGAGDGEADGGEADGGEADEIKAGADTPGMDKVGAPDATNSGKTGPKSAG